MQQRFKVLFTILLLILCYNVVTCLYSVVRNPFLVYMYMYNIHIHVSKVQVLGFFAHVHVHGKVLFNLLVTPYSPMCRLEATCSAEAFGLVPKVQKV